MTGLLTNGPVWIATLVVVVLLVLAVYFAGVVLRWAWRLGAREEWLDDDPQ